MNKTSFVNHPSPGGFFVGGHSCQFSNIEPAAMGKGGGMFHNLNDWEDAIVPSVTAAVITILIHVLLALSGL